MSKGIKKGDLVRLNVNLCFTIDHGGQRVYPLKNYSNDKEGVIMGTRIATDEDRDSWLRSDRSNGLDCAGEPKLPPTAFDVKLHKDRVYTVIRARCRPQWSYREHPGQTLVLCSITGEEVYVKRDLIETVPGEAS